MKLVKQRGRYDCGVACLAMLAEVDYDEAVKLLGRDVGKAWPQIFQCDDFDRIGVTMEEVGWILFRLGINSYRFHAEQAYKLASPWLYRMLTEHRGTMNMPHDTDVQAFILRGGTAMLGVPSLNYPGGSHWIVVSGRRVFDPTNMMKEYFWTDVFDIDEGVMVWPK